MLRVVSCGFLIATSTLAFPARAQQSSSPAPAAQQAPAPQSQSTPAAAQPDDGDDDIVVNGRAPPGAVIGDIPPENQLNPRQIASYGVGTVSELLDQIALQTGSAQGDGAPVVLVNGRRVSGVNEVADLPTESILRVDILPEEVALKYGYSAEQKVVNIILRRRFRSVVVEGGGGMSTQGGGQNLNGDATLTRIRDNDRINIAARASGSAALFEDQRGIAPNAASFDSVGNVIAPNGGEIDPGLSALAGAPVTIAGVPTGIAMPSLADFASQAGQANLTDDTAFRTLRPSQRSYSVNAVLAHALSSKVTSSFNLQAQHSTNDADEGLASGTLLLPAGNPYSPFSQTVAVARYFGDTPLTQDSGTTSLHGGATLNVDFTPKWRLSVVAGYDHSESDTQTVRGYDLAAYQAALDAGDPTVSPYGPAPAAPLGDPLVSDGRSRSDTGNASALLTGSLLDLPAGALRMSLRAGGTTSSTEAETTGALAVPTRSLGRSTAEGMASLDVPIASKTFLRGLGTLTANVNLSRSALSDFSTLEGYGYGINWTPLKAISLIASVAGSQRAPTLQQLDSPAITTANVRVYDYATGTTATVARTSGGNPGLTADDRRQFKLGGTFKPFSKVQLTITANYVDTSVRNPVGAFPGASPSLEAAFPDRFVRDPDGELTAIDTRPVNFARQDERQLRWGFDFTQVLRQPKRPARPPGFAPRWRPRAEDSADRPPPPPTGDMPPPAAAPDTSSPSNAAAGDGSQNDIVVTGRRDDDNGPPAAAGGFGRRGGFGGRGRFGGGFGGPGGPGGGFGGRGGGGGRGFGGGAPPVDRSVSLEITFYHTWIFHDVVQIRPDLPEIDLLHGGTLGGGAQPSHRLEFNAGLSDNGVGLRLTGQWQSASEVDGSEAAGANGTLRFASFATLNLRGFINLEQRFPKTKWVKGTRITLSASNLLNQHQRVTDAAGQTPLAYLPAYTDPLGRTLAVSIRKIF